MSCPDLCFDGLPSIWGRGAFLSFGEDTQDGFAGHIYSALLREGIDAFKGDKRIDDMEEPEILKIIVRSRFFYIVFSQDYADSPSRLDALAKMSEVIGKPGYYVVPIFFDVRPSDVRNQNGKYKELFDKYEGDFSDDLGRVQRWRSALTQVADLAGYDVRDRSESDVIVEIVNDANHKLRHRFSGLPDDLVKMHSHILATNKELLRSLEAIIVALDKNSTDTFVDVACFYNGADEKYVTKILEHCGCNPQIGIRVLSDRSLLKIVNERLCMNDVMQELGRKIAKGEFPNEPAKWSRLWSFKDIQTVDTGTEKVEAIVLSPEDLQETPLKAEALSEMSRLRLIIFPNNVKFSGNLNSLSNELRLLSWNKFPFSSLPSSFEPDKLVELVMHDSHVIELWQGAKIMPSLRNIDLRGSKSLIKTPNVKGVQNLERLDLEGCTGLLQVDPSVGDLKRIMFLNLRNCDSLINIPDAIFISTSLEILNLSGCPRLAEFLNFKGPQAPAGTSYRAKRLVNT